MIKSDPELEEDEQLASAIHHSLTPSTEMATAAISNTSDSGLRFGAVSEGKAQRQPKPRKIPKKRNFYDNEKMKPKIEAERIKYVGKGKPLSEEKFDQILKSSDGYIDFLVALEEAAPSKQVVPPGCVDMPHNSPIKHLPTTLYRWQSFEPKNGVNLPNDQKGIPTATDPKVAANLGALSFDYLLEIDTSLLNPPVGQDFWQVASGKNGWEIKLWCNIPQAAIKLIKGKAMDQALPKGKK